MSDLSPDLLSRISDFEQTRAYHPTPPDHDPACLAYTRLHWALASLPPPALGGTPMVAVNGVVYAAGDEGKVVRGRIVAEHS